MATNSSSWQNPTNELGNYTKYANRDVSGLACSSVYWDSPEIAAFRCNQSDDCAGFIYYKNNGGGSNNKACMVFKTQNTIVRQIGSIPYSTGVVANNGTDTYYKKTTSWRKANNPDTNDPSILPTGVAQSTVKLFSDYGGNWAGTSGGTAWNLTKAGLISNAGGNTALGSSTGEPFCNDCVSSYCIPLGWKYVFDQNDNSGNGNAETYEAGGPRTVLGGFCAAMDSQTNGGCCGMQDQMSNGILQNIGFDVVANWDTMTNKGVVPADATRIKTRWCTQSITNMSTPRCATFYNSSASNGGPSNTFNGDAMTVCSRNGYDWGGDTFCINRVNDALVNGTSSDKSTADLMISTYCSTGANNQKQVCACYNAVHAGSVASCVSQPNLPGCDSIATKVNALTAAASTFYQNDPQGLSPYCACDQCKQAENSTGGAILRQNPSNCNSTLNACFQNNTINNFTGGNLDASCNFNLSASPSGGGGGGTPSPSGGGGGGTPSPQKDSKLTYEFIGGGLGLFCLFFVFIFMLLIALD